MTSSSISRLLVTGASGRLGRLVIDALLRKVPASRVVAGLRDIEGDAARRLTGLGIEVRALDYSKPDGLVVALAGIDRLLLISSSEVGQRFAQHRNVIGAAKGAGVDFLAYTSVLHADVSPLGLAGEHRQTEAEVRASGIPFALLRNGWYNENHAASIPPAIAHGVFLGSAGNGRISSAARLDYAEAAALVLLGEGPVVDTYELAGDGSYSLTEFAREIAAASGRPVAYKDLPEAEFKAALIGAGLPEPIAALLADSDKGAAAGALFEDGGALGRLIGRSTTPVAITIAQAVNGTPG